MLAVNEQADVLGLDPYALEAARLTASRVFGRPELDDGVQCCTVGTSKDCKSVTKHLQLTVQAERDDIRKNVPGIEGRRLRGTEEVVSSKIPQSRDLVETIKTEFSLNEAQAAAFQLLTRQFLKRLHKQSVDQLLLIVDGPAGGGKTHIVKAYRAFLTELRQLHTLRCGAYTGSAANNIDGQTLHGMLHVGRRLWASA